MYSYYVKTKVSPSFKALPKNAVNVSQKLIKGSALSLKDVLGLKKENVKLIVDLRHKSHKYVTIGERAGCKIAGIDYVRFPTDFKNGKFAKMEDFDTFIKMVDGCDGLVFVHCNGGRHRSTILCGGYLLKKEKKSPQEVLNWMLKQDYITRKYFPAYNKPKSARKEKHGKDVINGLVLTLKQFMKLFNINISA